VFSPDGGELPKFRKKYQKDLHIKKGDGKK
jgi:hypothetical protein